MKFSVNRRPTSSAVAFALVLLGAATFVSPRVLLAQPTVSAGATSAVARARALTNDGEDAKSRTLLDSLLNSVARDSFDAAEALYWRALLNEGSASAELDWKRIVVDVPFSPRASEALLKLSELDMQHANRLLARQHANQLLNEYPDAPERSRAMLVLARSYFDERDAPRACGVLTVVRKEAPLSAVEVRLQADELQQQCRNVREVAMGAAPDSTTATTPPTTVPPLATQTATLPPATVPPATPPRAGRGAAVNVDSVRRDSVARAVALRNAAKLATDSIRRDSVIRAIAQRVVDSTRRDSITKAGLLQAAAQRIADNARRDSISRATLRRDSIALDSTGKNPATRNAASRAGNTAANPPREILVFVADSARGDSLSREAAALEARIRNAVAVRDSIKRDSLARAAAKRATDARAGKWTVQIAAYQNKADADALVKRLTARDISARVVGTKKPFRVQAGRYATRADAAAALATLKKNGQKTGFVVEVGK